MISVRVAVDDGHWPHIEMLAGFAQFPATVFVLSGIHQHSVSRAVGHQCHVDAPGQVIDVFAECLDVHGALYRQWQLSGVREAMFVMLSHDFNLETLISDID